MNTSELAMETTGCTDKLPAVKGYSLRINQQGYLGLHIARHINSFKTSLKEFPTVNAPSLA